MKLNDSLIVAEIGLEPMSAMADMISQVNFKNIKKDYLFSRES